MPVHNSEKEFYCSLIRIRLDSVLHGLTQLYILAMQLFQSSLVPSFSGKSYSSKNDFANSLASSDQVFR